MKISSFILILSVLALCACNVKEMAPAVATAKQELTIEAYRADDEPGTRTYRDDSDGSVWWVPGDAISLFYGSGTDGGSEFTSNATDTVKITQFTGVINVITGTSETSPEGYSFWGLYPYSGSAFCDGSSVTMTLPATQTAQAGSFATRIFPSIGRSQGLHMGFYNICSGLKFSVKKAGVKRVTLKSRNGEAIAGTAKVSFDAEGLPVAEILNGLDEVVLESPEGESFEVGKYYFIVMFPTTFTGGFTVKLETLSGIATYERTTPITAKRSVFGMISNIDSGLTYTPRSGNIPIPDANFKAYLVENFDDDGDGEISFAEAVGIDAIECMNDEIASLKGIEYMPALTCLCCDYNKIASLDVSNNTNLTILNCNNNQLTSLDVSNNSALSELWCSGNSLTTLDVSNNMALEDLKCYNNQLTSLDVSNHTSLTGLWCSDNQLVSLNVSNCTSLTKLQCYNNQLTDLDVTTDTALDYLSCSHNKITSLDVTNCLALKQLLCGQNLLTTLDVTACNALNVLNCTYNGLTSLNVLNNTALTTLLCNNNQLTSLDLSHNAMLAELSCNGNRLTNLDVSDCKALERLFCSPMNDLLSVLYIYQGQDIWGVTYDRSSVYIPDETQILVKNPPEAIDLGLSVKWASFNVGASRPEDYGDYFAWGEIEPYYKPGYAQWESALWRPGKNDGYTWTSYIWCNGSETSLTKYNTNPSSGTVDNNLTLDPEDDAAQALWGGGWRMPTKAEIQELVNNCTTVWTTENGVNGRRFTSKKAGYTDKSIFIPASGFRDHLILSHLGLCGSYWSSSLSVSEKASVLGFRSDQAYYYDDYRLLGFTIRPVCP